jgi:colanic acid biosynthesis glycosyl transferase WcaI
MRIFLHDYPGHPFVLELSRELARRGHVVRHAYFAADQGPKGQVERLPGDPETFSIQPISIRGAYSKSNLVRRHMLDGVYGVAAARALTAFRPDVVLIGQTPPNALGPLQRAARRTGAGFILWLQDVFGLAAAALLSDRWGGAGRLAAMHYQALERRILRRSDHIIAISADFLPYLAQAGVSPANVSVIPNWGPLSAIPPRPRRNRWSDRHGLSDKTVFTYTGTLGLKHNPNLIYRLAQAFQDRPDIAVQVTCTGVGADWLRARAAEAPLPNLQILPLAPLEDLPDLYGTADVLIGLLEADAGSFSAPSKVLAYLCAGRAVLLSAPPANASALTLATAGAGVVTAASDEAAFLAAARILADSPAERAAMGAAGRAYAEAMFDIGRVGEQFEPLLARAGAACAATHLNAA